MLITKYTFFYSLPPTCNLKRIKLVFDPIYGTITKNMRFRYTKHFSKFITRIRSNGIIFNWVRRSRGAVRMTSETETVMADIRFEHVSLIIYGFVLLIVVSFMIFLLEIVIFENHKKFTDTGFRRSDIQFN